MIRQVTEVTENELWTGDRIVAVAEIVSASNKVSQGRIKDFVENVLAALRYGVHVLVIDPFPPSRRDPQGIHGIIWKELGEQYFELAVDSPLTLVSYRAGSPITAYVEPTRVAPR